MLVYKHTSTIRMTSYLFSQCFHWGDVDTATFCVVQQHPQNSKLSTDCLSTAGGSAHKHIVITVVHRIEHCRDRKNTDKSRKQCEMNSEPLLSHEPKMETLCVMLSFYLLI